MGTQRQRDVEKHTHTHMHTQPASQPARAVPDHTQRPGTQPVFLQEHGHTRHHLLPPGGSTLGVELALESRYSDTGHEHPKWQLNWPNDPSLKLIFGKATKKKA